MQRGTCRADKIVSLNFVPTHGGGMDDLYAKY
jgi:hypothetical protein